MNPAPSIQDADLQSEGTKRRQILDGARRRFMASGFEAASMGEIAREAKVSKGTLYVYFDSKEALFEALIEEKKRDSAERLQTLEHMTGPVAEVLTTFATQLVLALSNPDHVALVRLVIGASDKFPAIARSMFEAGPAHGAARLERFLAERRERGEIVGDDLSAAAWQFIGMCHHRVMTESLLGGLPAPDEAEAARRAARTVSTFLAAYGARD